MAKPIQHLKCTHSGCDRAHHAKGLCAFHHQRQARGIPLDAPMRKRAQPRPVVDGRQQCYGCDAWHPIEDMQPGRAICRPCKRRENARYREADRASRETVQSTQALLGRFMRGAARVTTTEDDPR